MYERLEAELEQQRKANRFRELNVSEAHDFGSNDYLGFATHPELERLAKEQMASLPLSASSSRLLPGNHSLHLEAEQYFARFIGAPSALLFNSGYDANVSLLSTLPTRHDVILFDDRAHASVYDGARHSLARSYKFAHNSVGDLKNRIERVKRDLTGQIYIVVESVYSMDGDICPLAEIMEIATANHAILIVDEAHATGVLGERGKGLTSAHARTPNLITVHTCGKALGAAGAFVAGERAVIDYLINRARAFIYTTALPPIIPAQIINSIRLLEAEGTMLTQRLASASQSLRSALQSRLRKWSVPAGITPIIPVIIGSEIAALEAAQYLLERGFSVPAIRPPTVPNGSSRLRLNVSLKHSEQTMSSLVEAIVQAEQQSFAQ